jgi:hypothetical protein
LKIEEPSGSICSGLNRQTVGGGALLGDTLAAADKGSETYVAAQAFSGEYKVTVDRIWGQPNGGKARLEIIQHQGTPQQSVKLIGIDFKAKDGNQVKVKLDQGRRTVLASVPPPGSLQPPVQKETANADTVFRQLRALADPSFTGTEQSSVRGSLKTPGVTAESRVPAKDSARSPADQVAFQTRVEPFVANSAQLTAQAVISADRRYVRLSLSPFFNSVTRVQQVPVVSAPFLPGPGGGPRP